MAWGLKTPAMFGMFFPRGEVIGHEEKLIDYYENKMPDSEKQAFEEFRDYSQLAYGKYKYDNGPLAQHEMPTEYRIKKPYKSLAALMQVNDGLLIVQQPFKDLIETFEPSVHQFWPITITLRNGELYPMPCYGLAIMNHIQSVLADQSEWNPGHSWPPHRYRTTEFFDSEKHRVDRVILSREAIGNAHLWRDTHWQEPGIFISNEFRDAVKDVGLRIFPARKAKEVL